MKSSIPYKHEDIFKLKDVAADINLEIHELKNINYIGIYFLFCGSECIYVGKSSRNVLARIVDHKANEIKFDKAFFMPIEYDVDEELIMAVESFCIWYFMPKCNKEIRGYTQRALKECGGHILALRRKMLMSIQKDITFNKEKRMLKTMDERIQIQFNNE